MDSPSRWAPDESAGMCAAETNTKTPKQNLQTKDKAMASDSDLV